MNRFSNPPRGIPIRAPTRIIATIQSAFTCRQYARFKLTFMEHVHYIVVSQPLVLSPTILSDSTTPNIVPPCQRLAFTFPALPTTQNSCRAKRSWNSSEKRAYGPACCSALL